MHKLMPQEFDGINQAKVLMHNSMNNLLPLMRVELLGDLPYPLGQFDDYLHISGAMGIPNPNELNVRSERPDAVPNERKARGIDTVVVSLVTDSPAARRLTTSTCCTLVSDDRRPIAFPSARARAIPA